MGICCLKTRNVLMDRPMEGGCSQRDGGKPKLYCGVKHCTHRALGRYRDVKNGMGFMRKDSCKSWLGI